MTRKKKLAALILACLSSGSMVCAAESPHSEEAVQEVDTYDLPAVTVEGRRLHADAAPQAALPGGFQAEQTNFGLMGDQDVMQVPYTAQSLTTKNFDT